MNVLLKMNTNLNGEFFRKVNFGEDERLEAESSERAIFSMCSKTGDVFEGVRTILRRGFSELHSR